MQNRFVLCIAYLNGVRFVMLTFCRYSLVIDPVVLDKQRSLCERLKNMKLNPALLEWAPQLTSSAVEVEESRVEIEVPF